MSKITIDGLTSLAQDAL